MSLKFNYLAVLDNKSSMTEIILDLFKQQVIKSQIYYLTQSSSQGADSETTLMKKLKGLEDIEPFYGDELLLIIYTDKMNLKTVEKVFKYLPKLPQFKVIIVNTTREVFELFLAYKLEGSFSLNLNKPEAWVFEYTLKHMLVPDITESAIDTFRKRMRGQWRYLDTYIHELNVMQVNQLTSKDIENVVPVYIGLHLATILKDVVINNGTLVSHFTELSKFQHADKFLDKEFRGKFEQLLFVYKKRIAGELSNSNYVDFVKSHNMDKNNKNNKLNLWDVKLYLEQICPVVSMQWVYKLYCKYTANAGRKSLFLFILEMCDFYNLPTNPRNRATK